MVLITVVNIKYLPKIMIENLKLIMAWIIMIKNTYLCI